MLTLRDAAADHTTLPKVEHEAGEWQTAMKFLLLAAKGKRPVCAHCDEANAASAQAEDRASAATQTGQGLPGRLVIGGKPQAGAVFHRTSLPVETIIRWERPRFATRLLLRAKALNVELIRVCDSRGHNEKADASAVRRPSHSAGGPFHKDRFSSAHGPFQKGHSKQTPFRAIGAAFVILAGKPVHTTQRPWANVNV